jgi:hypothetical protein
VRLLLSALVVLPLLAATPRLQASTDAERLLDRTVVRWSAPELGGAVHPRFLGDRELSFLGRLEALADPELSSNQPQERHRRAALDRAIAESLVLTELESSPLDDAELEAETQEARRRLELLVGGWQALAEAAQAEGIGEQERLELYRRRAQVRLLLRRSKAPVAEPSERERAEALQSGRSPFTGRPLEEVRAELGRWLVEEGIERALRAKLQAARGRLKIVLVGPPRAPDAPPAEGSP